MNTAKSFVVIAISRDCIPSSCPCKHKVDIMVNGKKATIILNSLQIYKILIETNQQAWYYFDHFEKEHCNCTKHIEREKLLRRLKEMETERELIERKLKDL